MQFQKKRMAATKRRVVIIFLLSLAVMFLTYLVTKSLTMRIEMDDFTASIKKDTRENLVSAKNLLDGMVKDLEITADQIQLYGDLRSRAAREVLKFSHELNYFDATFVSDTEGNAFDDDGYKFSVADQPYFHQALAQKSVAFSEVMPSKRYGSIQIITYPLLSESQELEGVLFGLFSAETFSHLINNVVDIEKQIYIVDSNGTYINWFDEDHSGQDRRNFWEDLGKRHLEDMTIAELQAAFHAGQEGEFSYCCGDGNLQFYGYHMPLGIQDWQIVLSVEDTIVNSHIHSIRHVDAIDLLINAVCFTSMILCVYFYFKKMNDEIILFNQEISKSNEMLRMAMEHTNHIIFEYDHRNQEMSFKTTVPSFPFKRTAISPVPDYFLESDAIPDSSIPALKNLFETIQHEKSSQADIQVMNLRNKSIWYRVSMYNLYDKDGDIVGTVGSAEDISMLKRGEAAIKRRDELYKSFLANALLYARVNLTTAMVSELNGEDVQLPYQRYMANLIDENVVDEHHSYVTQALSLNALRSTFQRGQESMEVQCLIKGPQGPKWTSCFLHRVHANDSLKVTFFIRDIDEKKRKEMALKTQAERDGLTGLYNSVTSRAKINQVLCNNSIADGDHIFILIDVDNFKQINDTFGHAYGDQVLIDIANVLRYRFRSSDIIGRLGGDEFVIMLLNMRSEKYLETLISGLVSDLTRTYTQGEQSVSLSASMGVALAPINGTTFEELYENADKALYQVKKEGKNGYKRCE